MRAWKYRQPALIGLVVLALAGCAGGAADPAVDAQIKDPTTCQSFRAYGSLPGKTVSIFSNTIDRDADLFKKSLIEFQRCTGITVTYEGSNDFEQALGLRIQAGDQPDLVLMSQPGLVASLARQGVILPPPKAVVDLVNKNWSADWRAYGTVGGKLYAAPAGASVKSLVWYSPKFFAANDLTPPRTWAEMIALTQKLTKPGIKGAGAGFKPWCAGFSSGSATGWPGTDWIEDLLLRSAGPGVYDQWVSHKIPFNDPEVQTAFNAAGQILRNEAFVNGGGGGVKSIDTVTYQNGGLPILRNRCAMHRQASFYAASWPKSTVIAKDGDVFAFLLPPITPSKGQAVLGAGDFVAAFSDRPAVQALQTYLASGDWATARAALGGFATANKSLNQLVVNDPIQKLSVQALQAPDATFRFDGSDLMPTAVGTKSFWAGMVDWINGASTAEVTARIEASWPTPK